MTSVIASFDLHTVTPYSSLPEGWIVILSFAELDTVERDTVGDLVIETPQHKSSFFSIEINRQSPMFIYLFALNYREH